MVVSMPSGPKQVVRVRERLPLGPTTRGRGRARPAGVGAAGRGREGGREAVLELADGGGHCLREGGCRRSTRRHRFPPRTTCGDGRAVYRQTLVDGVAMLPARSLSYGGRPPVRRSSVAPYRNRRRPERAEQGLDKHRLSRRATKTEEGVRAAGRPVNLDRRRTDYRSRRLAHARWPRPARPKPARSVAPPETRSHRPTRGSHGGFDRRRPSARVGEAQVGQATARAPSPAQTSKGLSFAFEARYECIAGS